MDYHYHARLTVVGREALAKRVLQDRLSLKEAEAEFKLSRQSAGKWVRRYREQGVAGLRDRSSRPHRSPRVTSEEKLMEIERLRRQRWTGVRIARQLELSPATVSRVLRRMKLSRIRDIEPKLPPNRYEHAAPGDLLHLDIKRLVRIQRPSHRVTGNRRDGVKGIGAEFLHIAIDDHNCPHCGISRQEPNRPSKTCSRFFGCLTSTPPVRLIRA
jgi:transposase